MMFATNSFADYYIVMFGNGAVMVDASNSNDLAAALCAKGIDASGTITFDSETNTLTLDDATINYTGGSYLIYTYSKPITIELIGINDITMPENTAYCFMNMADLTIKGEGRLNIEHGSAAIAPYGNLIIENTTVNLMSDHAGIYGNGTSAVTIKNSTVTASGSLYGAISNIASLDLQGCKFSAPTGADFDPAQKGVCVGGALVKTEPVSIIPSASTAIENAEMHAAIFAREGRIFGAENARIFDVLGRDVTRQNGNLHGVYVVKTDKMAIKVSVE